MVLSDQCLDLSICQDVGNALCRILWIKRHISSTCLENTEQADHHLQRALHADAHQYIWPDALLLQVVSELIGAMVEFAIGQRLVFKNHGDVVWGSFNLLFKKLVDTLILRIFRLGVVPLHQDSLPPKI